MKLRNVVLVVGLLLVGMLSGCTTLNPYTGEEELSRTSIGTGVGALGGALAGQLIGGNTTGTLIGAGIGAAVGGITGNYMDRQNTELRRQLQGTGIQVARVGKDIRLIMPGDITFENDRSDIRGNFYNTLNSVALVLNKFKHTTVKVAGFASSTGSAMHNQELSELRAKSVASYLIAQQVDPNRLMAVGYGARSPIASNATRAGQAKNRRVEITIHQLSK
jgi:outer membrane protein OmpA-like peptidoglycan-associated protein